MNDTQHQSCQFQDQSNEDSEISAQLNITVDKDGLISYNCDWIPGETGIIGLATIFYKLLLDNLSTEILQEIKKQCVLNNSEIDYISMINLINDFNYKAKNQDEDIVVVAPDQVYQT